MFGCYLTPALNPRGPNAQNGPKHEKAYFSYKKTRIGTKLCKPYPYAILQKTLQGIFEIITIKGSQS